MKVDMSPKAITARIRQVEQLRRLCLSLAGAKPLKRDNKPEDSRDTRKPKRR